jgi:RHS repeat-associated protein
VATAYPGHNPAGDPGDSDYDKKEFAYDAAGKLIRSEDQKGEYVAFAFDLAGRLETRKYYNISDVLQDTDTFTSDLSARPLTAAKGRYNNTVTFTYDVAGRAATETLTTGGANYEVEYGYDYGSRLIELTYPDDTVVDRGYTDRGELDDIDYESAAVADHLFDDGGRLTQTTFGNSLVEARGYTRDDDMATSIGITGVTGFGYSYDANKNRTAQTDSVQTAHAWTADYDDEDRLTDFDKSTYNQHDQDWTLSNVGDWDSTTLGGAPESRIHDPVHQLTQRGQTSLSYDAKGNLTQDKNGQQYTWDQDNKLSAADLDGNNTPDATYEYDALGRRVTKTYNGLTMLYVRAGWRTLAEYENGGSGYQLARKFVYGDYVDEPLMMVRLVEEKKDSREKTESGTETGISITPAAQMIEEKYYYHANANYNIAAMTNAAAAIVEQYRYSAYGIPVTITTNTIGNPFYFTGKRYDAELGWYDYNFRPFDPAQGRFPVREDEYRNTVNSYQYCNAAPLHKTDPTGKIVVGFPGMWTSKESMIPVVEAIGNKLAPDLLPYEKVWPGAVRLEVSPGGKTFVAEYKSLIKESYKEFRERKSTQECSLEQFVAIGHSHSATAIYELIKEGHFSNRELKLTPAALIMVDPVLGGDLFNNNKDLSKILEYSGIGKKTTVLNYYQTDENVMGFGTGDPVGGVTMVTRSETAEGGYEIHSGGLRIPNTSHKGILKNSLFLNHVTRYARTAYIMGVVTDNFEDNPMGNQKWDTWEGGPAW